MIPREEVIPDSCEVKLSKYSACKLGTWGCISDHTSDELADFTNHHISGFAQAAVERGLDSYFRVPLISEVLPGLWMGGCKYGAQLPEDFDVVVSMYPWERFRTGDNTVTYQFKALDGEVVPDNAHEAAELAYREWASGKKVLIHCQAGLNRSGLVTALVLLMGGVYSARDAINLLRHKRCDLVLCNEVFERFLLSENPLTPPVQCGPVTSELEITS